MSATENYAQWHYKCINFSCLDDVKFMLEMKKAQVFQEELIVRFHLPLLKKANRFNDDIQTREKQGITRPDEIKSNWQASISERGN